MGIFAKLFNKNSEEVSSRNVEDFVSLTRVYFCLLYTSDAADD